MNDRAVLVVGAGFAGAVCARELAEAGRDVLLIDRRSHVGGNAYDTRDSHDVLVHPYGPHIFHTNSERVVNWLSRFTQWRPYEHRVRAYVSGKLLPIPINRTTINSLYGLALNEEEVEQFLAKVRENRSPVLTSEDVVLNNVGRDLCEHFFRGYTRKQWGLDLSELNATVAARIPTRTNDDDRYFTDTFQAMPQDGYTQMFRRILDHGRIEVRLGVEFDLCDQRFAHTIYTGRVDAFYGYRFGRLPYRSLRFEHQHIEGTQQYQPVSTVNYPNDNTYTRITEFKHITGQKHSGTSIVREYPQWEGEPYYPVPSPENEQIYQRYKTLADAESTVTFMGRLAQYRYYNMDQVVGAALAAMVRLLGRTQ